MFRKVDESRQSLYTKTDQGRCKGSKKKLPLGTDIKHPGFESKCHRQSAENQRRGFFKGAAQGRHTTKSAM